MSWDTACQTKLIKIKVSQNNCLCCIFDSLQTKEKHFTLLENILKLKIGSLVHKIQYQQKETPPALYELAQLAFGVDNYHNTRYAANQNPYRPSSRTNYGLARFSIVESQT